MKLYLISAKEQVGYDSFDSFLIRAKDTNEAREIANDACADEGRMWGDPILSTCEIVTQAGDKGIIISSFNAG